MKKIYTIDEYRDMVKKAYPAHFPDEKSRSDAERYFESDEAQEEINARYKADIDGLIANKITGNVFRNGCVNSVAYCLYLMTE